MLTISMQRKVYFCFLNIVSLYFVVTQEARQVEFFIKIMYSKYFIHMKDLSSNFKLDVSA